LRANPLRYIRKIPFARCQALTKCLAPYYTSDHNDTKKRNSGVMLADGKILVKPQSEESRGEDPSCSHRSTKTNPHKQPQKKTIYAKRNSKTRCAIQHAEQVPLHPIQYEKRGLNHPSTKSLMASFSPSGAAEPSYRATPSEAGMSMSSLPWMTRVGRVI
jgi:hypothetical protein